MRSGMGLAEILWSYIPGLPISICLYYAFISPLTVSDPNKFDIEIITVLFITVPLVVGLCLDGLRHFAALAFDQKGVFWDFTPRTDHEKLTNHYKCDVIISYILSRSILFYHIFEFFFNFSISLFLTAILLISCFGEPRLLLAFIVTISALVSLLMSQVYKRLKSKFVSLYLPGQQRVEIDLTY